MCYLSGLAYSTTVDRVAVVKVGYQLASFLFDSRGWPSFDSRFTKFVMGSSGDLKFVILVEDFGTGGPSSITVRKEYLFVFQF